MISGPKFFGAYERIFTDICEDVSWVVVSGGRAVAYSSEPVAEKDAAALRARGQDARVERRVAVLRCGEVVL